jgi:hypothetical protein
LLVVEPAGTLVHGSTKGYQYRNTKTPELAFRALLTEGGTMRVELTKA